MKNALKFDESTFSWPEGLTEEGYQKKFAELLEIKKNLEENPQLSQKWLAFGNTLEFFNDHEGAVEAFEISHELAPTFLSAHNIASINHYFLKKFDVAEKYYYEALRLKPDFYQSYVGLEDIYQYNVPEKRDQYEPLLLRAIESDPVNKVVYLSDMTEFFANEGYNELKAREYFIKVQEESRQEADILRERYPELFFGL